MWVIDLDWIIVILGAGMLGTIPAMIADRKRHPLVLWRMLWLLLVIIALPFALWLKLKEKIRGDCKKCPRCAQIVMAEAKICPRCKHSFDSALVAIRSANTDTP
jgi:hypothetical protein